MVEVVVVVVEVAEWTGGMGEVDGLDECCA